MADAAEGLSQLKVSVHGVLAVGETGPLEVVDDALREQLRRQAGKEPMPTVAAEQRLRTKARDERNADHHQYGRPHATLPRQGR